MMSPWERRGTSFSMKASSSSSGLHQDHHSSRFLQPRHHLLQAVSSGNIRPLGLLLQEVIHLLRGPVVGADLEAVVIHVEDEVLAHDGQTNESDVTVSFSGHLADCSRVAHQLSVATGGGHRVNTN